MSAAAAGLETIRELEVKRGGFGCTDVAGNIRQLPRDIQAWAREYPPALNSVAVAACGWVRRARVDDLPMAAFGHHERAL